MGVEKNGWGSIREEEIDGWGWGWGVVLVDKTCAHG